MRLSYDIYLDYHTQRVEYNISYFTIYSKFIENDDVIAEISFTTTDGQDFILPLNELNNLVIEEEK